MVKKLVFRLLVNDVTGYAICKLYPREIPDLRWSPYRFTLERDGVDRKIAASLFFGFYEAGEIRFIHKYFDGNADVVELGGSMGIVSSHIASRLSPGRRLITVEANPYLIEVLTANIEKYKRADTEFLVLNNAIGYDGDVVELQLTGNSTETRAVKSPGIPAFKRVTVASVRLSDIVHKYGLKDYTLVSDIEGAEYDLLRLDKEALINCREIFIELHETESKHDQISIRQLVECIENVHDFTKVDGNGPVMYFRK